MTLYFPTAAQVRFDYARGRRWSTVVQETPTGRTQRRRLWRRPKHSMKGTFTGEQPSTAREIQPLRDFLFKVAGRAETFYVFMLDEEFFVGWEFGISGHGHDNGDGTETFTLPFKGCTIDHLYVDGTEVSAGDLSWELLVGTGPGDEDQITINTSGFTPDAPLTIDVLGLRRFPVICLNDREDWSFDFSAADPTRGIVIDVEEDFSVPSEGGGAGEGGGDPGVGGGGTGLALIRVVLTRDDGAHYHDADTTHSWVADTMWLLRNGEFVDMTTYTVGGTGNRALEFLTFSVAADELIEVIGSLQP